MKINKKGSDLSNMNTLHQKIHLDDTVSRFAVKDNVFALKRFDPNGAGGDDFDDVPNPGRKSFKNRASRAGNTSRDGFSSSGTESSSPNRRVSRKEARKNLQEERENKAMRLRSLKTQFIEPAGAAKKGANMKTVINFALGMKRKTKTLKEKLQTVWSKNRGTLLAGNLFSDESDEEADKLVTNFFGLNLKCLDLKKSGVQVSFSLF